jgi:putative membrane protein
MRGFLARVLITAFGLTMADFLLGGVRLEGWLTLVLAAILLGFVNAFVRPLVIFLTFPITLFTLGLFLLVINGAMVMLVAWLVPSFHIDGLGWGVLAAIIIGLTGWVANAFVGPTGRVEVWTVKSPNR